MGIFVRSGFPFNYDTDTVSDETGLFCADESRAKQSFREETDINTIVRRFGLTGQMPENVRMPTYGDFTDVVDYQSAMNALIAAQVSFDAMPAEVRKRFSNDPAEFVAFCSDNANLEEARKLGLAVPAKPAPEPVKPIEVVVVSDASAAGAQGST